MTLRILAISGSLRAASGNTALLRAARIVAPPGLIVSLYEGLGDLPHFNPDLDAEAIEAPHAVAELRNQIAVADGLLFCTPEYAHGVPGSLKNALDWLVSSSEIVNKPVAILNASPWAEFAPASLAETLKVMTARLVPEASITLSLLGRKLDDEGIASAPEFEGPLVAALKAFAFAIKSGPLHPQQA
jgi:chromate reductase